MLVAIIVSLLSGFTLVTARVANAKLAEKTSALTSTFYNYVVGLLLSIVVLGLLGHSELPITSISTNVWIYTGGVISVFVVFIQSAVAPKIPTFYMTLLLFVGQLFAGVIIDSIMAHKFSVGQVIGGLFVLLGFTLNLMIDKKASS
ncbi:DMT family transporter [Cellulosilyticum ruminicola]|uniref:DMT family transporter n=1 Tax=Cellulosilyticum ruminicola TaxID=425254 RepID=UPI0006D11C8A|nr:DMT family transporter [Cellulosilyticum ruminicola]